MVEVPGWWILASGIYFGLSILWTIVLIGGLLYLYFMKISPLIKETQLQLRRVSSQAKAVAAKASSTADIVHAQTQHLLGNAATAGNLVTRQARTVGAALTGALVAARVVNFVRKML